MTEQDQLRRYYNADRDRFEQLKQQLDRVEKQLELIKLLMVEAAKAIAGARKD